jgi:transketolase
MQLDMRDAFFEELVIAARRDSRIVFLTADHGAFALQALEKEQPHRYINVGISEQNMIGVAAGLAASGKIVFAYGITPFVSLRVMEQITLDVAAMGLPVNIVSVGAGFTYSTDGPSHHGLLDMAALLAIPKLRILNSSDPRNTKSFVKSVISSLSPHYIRIEKEKLGELNRNVPFEGTASFGYSSISGGEARDILVVSTGVITHQVSTILDRISPSIKRDISHIDVHQIKPLTSELLSFLLEFRMIVAIEEGSTAGLGGNILQQLSLRSPRLPNFFNIGSPNDFVYTPTSRDELQETLELERKLLRALDWKE